MKVIRYVSIAVVLFVGIAVSNVNAQTVGFNITTNSGWHYDGSNLSLEMGNRYTAVNWQTSNQGNHSMWFGVFNTNYIKKGSMLFTSKKSDAFVATGLSLVEGSLLGAKRENAGDPYTTVGGTWAA